MHCEMLSFQPTKSGRYSFGQTNRVLVPSLNEEELKFYNTKKVGEVQSKKCQIYDVWLGSSRQKPLRLNDVQFNSEAHLCPRFLCRRVVLALRWICQVRGVHLVTFDDSFDCTDCVKVLLLKNQLFTLCLMNNYIIYNVKFLNNKIYKREGDPSNTYKVWIDTHVLVVHRLERRFKCDECSTVWFYKWSYHSSTSVLSCLMILMR